MEELKENLRELLENAEDFKDTAISIILTKIINKIEMLESELDSLKGRKNVCD